MDETENAEEAEVEVEAPEMPGTLIFQSWTPRVSSVLVGLVVLEALEAHAVNNMNKESHMEVHKGLAVRVEAHGPSSDAHGV